MNLLQRITKQIIPGTLIPKPCTQRKYRVKGWGMRRGRRALVYSIPNRKGRSPYAKGITTSEFSRAGQRLRTHGKLTRKWFNRFLSNCANEGPCNFTTIGGIFQLLGKAQYVKGTGYRKV